MLETKEEIAVFEDKIRDKLLECSAMCEKEGLLLYASAFMFIIGFFLEGPKGMRAAAEALEKAAVARHPFLDKPPEDQTLQ